MMDLDEMRKLIQSIDEQLVRLLERRTEVVKMVGAYKEERHLPIYVPEVEKKKIETLAAKCSYPGLVETIWPVIMCYSRSIE